METRLVTYKGKGAVDLAFPVLEKRTTIGRDAGNQVQLPDDAVSKHHALMWLSEKGWVIEDQASKNGTQVNGIRVEEAIVRNGDKIRIGPYEFVFETEVEDSRWTPRYEIDLSTKAERQTMMRAKSTQERAQRPQKTP